MLAASTVRPVDFLRARGICLAPPPAGAAELFPATGGIWGGRSGTGVSPSRTLQCLGRGEVARDAVWRFASGLAPGRIADLPGDVWGRAIPVRLSTRTGPLGHASFNP